MAEKQEEGPPEDTEAQEEQPEPQTEQASASKPSKKGKKKRRAEKTREPSTGTGASVGKALNTQTLQEIMGRLNLEEEKPKSHDFWDTQPVPKLDEPVTELGPVEGDSDDIRKDPLKLPDKFVWSDINLRDDSQISELYTLLYENYVEDDDNLFRFDYSRDFLRWALCPPGYKEVWHCGVRVSTSGKLVGFISAVPAMIRIQSHQQQMVEINFLCVHKKLRSKRVAPVLIKEITRRVNLEGIFQAVYTAGILIPKPISACRYWHRSINPKKLVEVQFSSLHRNMTLQRMIRLYRLPDDTATPGLRPYKSSDAPAVLALLNQQLSKHDLVPIFHSESEINYWFTPRPNIIDTFVVENPETKEVTDMMSFYHLSSSIVRHPAHKTLFVAYLFYYAHTATPLKDLLNDMLVVAKKAGCDVFNALDIMENKSVLEELKFATGDGNLHYYFYNFKCPEMPPEKVGLVLQ